MCGLGTSHKSNCTRIRPLSVSPPRPSSSVPVQMPLSSSSLASSSSLSSTVPLATWVPLSRSLSGVSQPGGFFATVSSLPPPFSSPPPFLSLPPSCSRRFLVPATLLVPTALLVPASPLSLPRRVAAASPRLPHSRLLPRRCSHSSPSPRGHGIPRRRRRRRRRCRLPPVVTTPRRRRVSSPCLVFDTPPFSLPPSPPSLPRRIATACRHLLLVAISPSLPLVFTAPRCRHVTIAASPHRRSPSSPSPLATTSD